VLNESWERGQGVEAAKRFEFCGEKADMTGADSLKTDGCLLVDLIALLHL
jgi:hypothetical protein